LVNVGAVTMSFLIENLLKIDKDATKNEDKNLVLMKETSSRHKSEGLFLGWFFTSRNSNQD
jgi:hypothetical protein